MDFHSVYEHVKALLNARGITLVLVLGGARWARDRSDCRPQVTARAVGEPPAVLELAAPDPDTAEAVERVLEQHVDVTRTGDRIHVDLTIH